jgi:DNA topoisomerase-1
MQPRPLHSIQMTHPLPSLPRSAPPRLALEPAKAAKAASLRYVTDAQPGLARLGPARAFRYAHPNGKRVSDLATLARIRALAIPPAWTNVWICANALGHIQATGRDARGRKQYRYHAKWRRTRDQTKYEQLPRFGAALPRIRARVRTDIAAAGLPREKILAIIVRLLETTHIRVGNEEYARDNKSYGLTTLLTNHVAVKGPTIHFRFRGKSGKSHAIDLSDPRVARIVKRCRDLPGQELFQYVDDAGKPQPIDSSDVNEYLRSVSGDEFTAKEFRTWAGTLLAAHGLNTVEIPKSTAKARTAIVAMVKDVAEELGNTPAVCRKCYIHPAVLNAYDDRPALDRWVRARAAARPRRGLGTEESALLTFLKGQSGAK